MSEELLQSELTALKNDMADVKRTLREVRDRVLTTPVCPSPGACIPLTARANDLEVRLRFLERVVWGAIGAFILVEFVIKFI